MTKAYQSWRDYPASEWRWPNFSPRELACKGTGSLMIDPAALDRLQALRNRLGRPLLITSAYRSPEHNKAVNGARNSYHMRGMAFDVRMENQDPHEFAKVAKAVGFTGVITYPRSGFIHVDNRADIGDAPFYAGDPFPTSAKTGLAMEPPRQPETLAENRNAQTAGGIAAVSGAVALADQVSKEGGILDRLQDPTTLLIVVAAVAVWLAWREWKGR
jgi:zinc D-Ala-D-Ala carboxypeptidase